MAYLGGYCEKRQNQVVCSGMKFYPCRKIVSPMSNYRSRTAQNFLQIEKILIQSHTAAKTVKP